MQLLIGTLGRGQLECARLAQLITLSVELGSPVVHGMVADNVLACSCQKPICSSVLSSLQLSGVLGDTASRLSDNITSMACRTGSTSHATSAKLPQSD